MGKGKFYESKRRKATGLKQEIVMAAGLQYAYNPKTFPDLPFKMAKGFLAMKSILVADRSIFIRSVLKKKLYKTDYRVMAEADNGKQAVLKYRTGFPDVVMLEFLLPQLNGFETLQEIIRINPEARVFMMSTFTDECLERQSREMGASGFILKPGFEGLLTALDALGTPVSNLKGT